MRFDINIKVSNIQNSIDFYVTQLSLFQKSHNYGMGHVLLKLIENNSFCLLLKEEEGYKNNNHNPIFSIGVDDCYLIYERIKNISFKNHAGLFVDETGDDSIFEYPLGRNFILKDPDNNLFLVSEWHKNAL